MAETPDAVDREARQRRAADQWDDGFRRHAWDYLADLPEAPRYGVIAGYVHHLLPRGDILDAGCGEGVLMSYLDAARYTYQGFDISDVAIDRALRSHPGAAFSTSAVEDFVPEQGAAYDIVVFNEILSQVDDPIEVLVRYHRLVKPDGHIIISQFRSKPGTGGDRFRQALESGLAADRFGLRARAEAQNSLTGLAWTVYCLDPARTIA